MPQADDLISALDGEWRFELFPEGAEQPSFTGQRTYKRLMLDHPSLSWLEKFDGRDVVVAGVMGYDPEKSQFYELGIPNVGGSDYWIGELQEDGASIEWQDPLAEGDKNRGVTRLINEDEFVFNGDSFQVVFARVEMN